MVFVFVSQRVAGASEMLFEEVKGAPPQIPNSGNRTEPDFVINFRFGPSREHLTRLILCAWNLVIS